VRDLVAGLGACTIALGAIGIWMGYGATALGLAVIGGCLAWGALRSRP
jgi:hypothetical protein